MLTDKVLKSISNEFIGDSEDSLFGYKSGPQLVEFFNTYFDTEYEYGSGFPSRWYFVVENIKKLYEEEMLSQFFTIVLSKEYLFDFEEIPPLDMEDMVEEIRKKFNLLLYSSPIKIGIHNDKVFLLNTDHDFEYIDSGSFADVYKITGTKKAKKKLKNQEQAEKDSRHRFKREYEITESLKDLNHVIYVDNYNPTEGSYEMELADSDLYGFITETEFVDDTQKMMIIRQVVETMSHVHNRDIIHRDLTPQNILYIDEMIKISDFGVGKELYQGYSYNTLMTKNIGQINYTAPEQLQSLKDAGKEADVFSLGRLINFILTSNPTDFNHDFKMICRKATAKNSVNRYSDAEDLLNDFVELEKSRRDGMRKERISSKMEKVNIDPEVSDYIISLEEDELEEFIEEEGYSARAMIRIIAENPTMIEDIISKLHNIVYQNTGLPFATYDKYAAVAHFVLSSESFEADYDEQILAAEIMGFVATSVNRFDVQRDVKYLLQLTHLDENIKKILAED